VNYDKKKINGEKGCIAENIKFEKYNDERNDILVTS